jgi:hypothetical protein
MADWQTDKAKEILREKQPEGLGTKANISDWQNYAKSNSYDGTAE